jgi:hypothetical protein
VGWYIRKSLKFGPFRLNLSKSGLGWSFGAKGARIGTGPKGEYVHLGRGGLYYRKSLRGLTSGEPEVGARELPSYQSPPAGVSYEGQQPMEETARDLQTRRERFSISPVATVGWIILLILAAGNGVPGWLLLPLVLIAILTTTYLHFRDRRVKRTELRFDLDGDADKRYERLLNALAALASSNRLWATSGEPGSAGLQPASLQQGPPPHVKTNVVVWRLSTPAESVFFFPDQVLVYRPNGILSIPYSTIETTLLRPQVVETGPTLPDVKVVGHQWRFSRLDGDPDLRYNNNRQLPVVEYGAIRLRSQQGWAISLRASSPEKAQTFVGGLQEYATGLAVPPPPNSEWKEQTPDSAKPSTGGLETDRTDPWTTICAVCKGNMDPKARYCPHCGRPAFRSYEGISTSTEKSQFERQTRLSDPYSRIPHDFRNGPFSANDETHDPTPGSDSKTATARTDRVKDEEIASVTTKQVEATGNDPVRPPVQTGVAGAVEARNAALPLQRRLLAKWGIPHSPDITKADFRGEC